MTLHAMPLPTHPGSAARRLVVLDPGFAHAQAHHLSVNLGIAQACSQRGVELVLVAAQDLDRPSRQRCADAGARVVAHWRTPGYPSHADRLELDEHERLAQQFSEEILALYESGFLTGQEDLHLHTFYSFHLEGLVRALWRLAGHRGAPAPGAAAEGAEAPRRLGGRLVLSFMFPPGCRTPQAGQPPTVFDAREHARHQRALQLLARHVGLPVVLATSCRSYQRSYQALWAPGAVLVHPSIVYRQGPGVPATAAGTPRRSRVLLFLGGAKSNKGIEFSLEFGARVAPLLPQCEFVFHFNHEFPGARQFEPGVQRLRAAGQAHGNVAVVEGNLDESAYDELLASIDTVCLFYDPREYRHKTSGVLWDMLRHRGVNWLVSRETWLSDELEELGIAHRRVTFGHADEAVHQLTELYRLAPEERAAAQGGAVQRELDDLLRPYGPWLLEHLGPPAGVQPQQRAPQAAAPLRVLVVRTHYGHFSPLSGPSGFVPWLRAMGVQVEEWAIPLGHDGLKELPAAQRDRMLQALQARMRSCQGNALPFETRLQRRLGEYDVVHFLDGEHAGLLTALARQQPAGQGAGPLLVATFHQPESVMKQILPDGSHLRGFDVLHVLAPSQAPFFEAWLPPERVRMVPHGLAAELLEPELPVEFADTDAGHTEHEVFQRIGSARVVLCVGSWLRDHDMFLATAALLRERPDCLFVAVGKGLRIDSAHLPNVVVFDRGLSDRTLHRLYRAAALSFLPLADAAANNAALESMAHGLPIVTTDLPATRYYTEEAAVYCTHQPQAYAQAIASLLHELGEGGEGGARPRQMSQRLRQRAMALRWQRVAEQVLGTLYRR